MERKTRLELATPTLARLCSTTELLPLVLERTTRLELATSTLARLRSDEEWDAHSDSFYDTEDEDDHAGFECHPDCWIVDTPAYDVCSRCGASK